MDDATRAWYEALDKPSWTPSGTVISAIWLVLYPLVFGVLAFVVWKAARGSLSWWVVLPFGVNVAANLAFTPILFGLRSLGLAAADVLVVLATIVWAMLALRPHYPVAAAIWLPYLAWVTVATVLQIEITRRNGL